MRTQSSPSARTRVDPKTAPATLEVDISFIVPVHNRWDLAEPVIRALEAEVRNRPGSRLIVVDDGSDEATRTQIDRLDPQITVQRHASALGYGTAVNRAVVGCTTPWVALLNSDLVLPPGWLAPMLAVMDHEPAAFAVGNIQTRVADGAIDHAGMVFHAEGYPIHFRADRAFIERQMYREFPAVTAACALVRRERFVDLGGFDESYRNGFEDGDLCLRARMRGWPSYVANHSWVGHHISASPGRMDREEANARRFLERWQPMTCVWQRDWENRLLREHRIRAGEMSDPEPQTRPRKARTRLRVMVDIARFGPAGENGGIKVLLRESLQALQAGAPGDFSFLLIVPDSVVAEAVTWIGPADEVWVLPPLASAAVSDDPRVRRLARADATLARLLDADVLYCPLGVSDYVTPDIPMIGVAVDVLHRERPECLPARDIAAREIWFDRMVHMSFRIQCNSHWVAGRVRHHFGATDAQMFVVHNAVHTRLAAAPRRALPSNPFFLYPANAWPHKNHDTLLVAWRSYAQRVGTQAWPLVLTGHDDDAMRRVAAHARALGIADHVSFRGFVATEDFQRLWEQAGALVFPSLHEGFGIPVLEAMHFGVPLIAGRIGSIPEVAGDAFLEADVRDPAALADALHRMSTDAALRKRLVERGHERASQFSFAPEIEKLADALRAAAAAFRAGRITWRWDQQEARDARRL